MFLLYHLSFFIRVWIYRNLLYSSVGVYTCMRSRSTTWSNYFINAHRIYFYIWREFLSCGKNIFIFSHRSTWGLKIIVTYNLGYNIASSGSTCFVFHILLLRSNPFSVVVVYMSLYIICQRLTYWYKNPVGEKCNILPFLLHESNVNSVQWQYFINVISGLPIVDHIFTNRHLCREVS